jgi:hypothetical protein
MREGAAQLEAIQPKRCGRGITRGFPLWAAGFFTAFAIAFAPVGGELLAEPVGGSDGEIVACCTEGFADTCQAIAGPDGGEHRGRLGGGHGRRL